MHQPCRADQCSKPWSKTTIEAVSHQRMGKRTMGKTGMYTSPAFRKGYEDAFDGKPLPENPGSQYRAGWQARKEYADFMTKAGFEQIDGEWISADDRRRDSH